MLDPVYMCFGRGIERWTVIATNPSNYGEVYTLRADDGMLARVGDVRLAKYGRSTPEASFAKYRTKGESFRVRRERYEETA